jgi:hypothetical protein
MAETDIEKALAMLEYAAARRGLYLTVHALNKVKEVLKWELVGDREKALEVTRDEASAEKSRLKKREPKT